MIGMHVEGWGREGGGTRSYTLTPSRLSPPPTHHRHSPFGPIFNHFAWEAEAEEVRVHRKLELFGCNIKVNLWRSDVRSINVHNNLPAAKWVQAASGAQHNTSMVEQEGR